MNKSDLIHSISKKTGLTQSEARTAIDNLVKVITDQVRTGKSVNLRGFGTFKAVTRHARKALHPRTRKPISVPAKKVPVFRPSPEWKTELLKKR